MPHLPIRPKQTSDQRRSRTLPRSTRPILVTGAPHAPGPLGSGSAYREHRHGTEGRRCSWAGEDSTTCGPRGESRDPNTPFAPVPGLPAFGGTHIAQASGADESSEYGTYASGGVAHNAQCFTGAAYPRTPAVRQSDSWTWASCCAVRVRGLQIKDGPVARKSLERDFASRVERCS